MNVNRRKQKLISPSLKSGVRLPGAALAYILIISVLVTLTLTGLLLLYSNQRVINDTFYYQEIARDNRESGVNLVLYGKGEKFGEFSGTIADSENDKWEVHSESWGLFGLMRAKGIHGEYADSQVVLFGLRPSGHFRDALFLYDRNRPLTLSGDTHLEGDLYLPQAGLKRGYVGGTGYTGSALHYGVVHNSKGEECHADYEWLEDTRLQLEDFFDHGFTGASRLNPGDSIAASWWEEPKQISSSVPIELAQVSLHGYCVIAAPEIIVKKSADLQDVVLFARFIRIEDGFEGRIQAFATDTLEVWENVKLHYPSALIVSNPERESYLSIASECLIEGVVLNDPDFFRQSKKQLGYTLISEKSEVVGSVYVTKNLDLKGIVTGNTVTGNFLLRTSSSVNENYLLGGRIQSEGLSKTFATGIFLPEPHEFVLIDWLK